MELKYGQRVLITGGFFEGQSGVCLDTRNASILAANREYLVKLKDSEEKRWINYSDLKKIRTGEK